MPFFLSLQFSPKLVLFIFVLLLIGVPSKSFSESDGSVSASSNDQVKLAERHEDSNESIFDKLKIFNLLMELSRIVSEEREYSDTHNTQDERPFEELIKQAGNANDSNFAKQRLYDLLLKFGENISKKEDLLIKKCGETLVSDLKKLEARSMEMLDSAFFEECVELGKKATSSLEKFSEFVWKNSALKKKSVKIHAALQKFSNV